MTTPSIVLLGNLLVDDVVLPDGTTHMGQAGGALLYAAVAATLWDARPGLVSVVGDDYPADVLTGAGDTFSVGFILAHLEGLPLEVCLQRAVATASFAVEGWGADALLAATTADADSRWRRWYGREIGP